MQAWVKVLIVAGALGLTGCQTASEQVQVDGIPAGGEAIDMAEYTVDEVPIWTTQGSFPLVIYKRVFKDPDAGTTTMCLAQNFKATTSIETLYEKYEKTAYLAARDAVIAPLTAIPKTTDMDVSMGRGRAACFGSGFEHSPNHQNARLFVTGKRVKGRF